MARPRAFDEQEVLTAAMHAFRRHGYAHISVADLETATGLRTSSLYNAFGDKAGLFRRALDHYVSSFVAPRLTTYAGDRATLHDLERLFLTLFEPPLDDGYGCLVVNSAAEFGSGDSIAHGGVRLGLELVHRHVLAVVRREVGVEAADARAAHLVLVYQGLLVLSRAGTLTPDHREAVHHHFQSLHAVKERTA
jgi:TetR/AcrR family transcriptional regulator, transcriptional repressor for nem operon